MRLVKAFVWILTLTVFALGAWGQELAPDPDFTEKLAAGERQAFLKRANFAEQDSYADFDLTYQRMQWAVDPAVWFIEGAVTSYFHPMVDGFNTISFDLDDAMQVDSVVYHHAALAFEHSGDLVTIQFPEIIPSEQTDSLTIWYRGEPSSTGFGAFVASTTLGGNPVLWTLSEPYGAKEWWPCKQSLVDKIDSIQVEVTCPEGNKVAGNGKLISEQTAGGKTKVTWKHHYPIVTYLVAISVTNYDEFTDYVDLGDGRSIEILNYVYPEQLDQWKLSSENTRNTMELYNDLIGEYPFADEKYGHAQFGWSGGMEHQTMSFMYNVSFGLVAHEMAHQWFGDCITLGSWHDIWLNEGFATYLTGLSYERLLDGQYWETWKKQQIDKITQLPGGSVYVTDPTDENALFSSRLSYSKGAYLLHMLRWELGDEAFFNGLKNYFNNPKIKYGFASHDDFAGHMEAAGDTSLTKFFDEWYYGSGYPNFQLNHFTDYGNNGNYKVTVTQSTSDGAIDFFTMHLPLRIWKDGVSTDLRLYQTSKEQTFVLGEKADSIQFDPDRWLISKNTLITQLPVLAEGKVKFYPNPVSSELNFVLNAGERIEQIVVADTEGRILKRLTEPLSLRIDVSDLSGGTYFFRLKTNKLVYSQSFVKVE